jgi:hypothetical protein
MVDDINGLGKWGAGSEKGGGYVYKYFSMRSYFGVNFVMSESD